MAITIQRVSSGLWLFQCDTEAGTSAYSSNPIGTPCRLVWAQGIKIGGAGGAADTIKIQRDDGSAADITDAADYNVADGVVVNFATFDDAEADFDAGDIIKVVTASGAVGRVTALFAEIQATP